MISPEGCASILWKSADNAEVAADAMGITAHRLKALGLVDKIVSEPVGGAHRDPKQMSAYLKRALGEFVIDGIKTTLPLHARLLSDPDFLSGNYDVHWLEHFVDRAG